MARRRLIAGGALLALPPAFAHHGWGGFDLGRPICLEGRAAEVRWRNPHAEMVRELAAHLRLPPGLAGRPLPAQTAPVDGAALLKAAVLPTRRARRWTIERAPLSRMNAWQVARDQGRRPGVAARLHLRRRADRSRRAPVGRRWCLRSALVARLTTAYLRP